MVNHKLFYKPIYYLNKNNMKSIIKLLYLSTVSVILISSCTTEDFKETNNINESNEENNDGNNNEDINNDETKTFNVFRISSSKDIALIENISAGDTIEWANGDYTDEEIILDFNGEENKNIVFKAEIPGNVSFTGKSSIEIRGKYITVTGFKWINPKPKGENLLKFSTGSYKCKIENCLIDGSGNELDATKNCKWISMYGKENTLTHCTLKDKKDMGALCVIWLEENIVPKHIISNNYFSRPETIYDENDEPANEQETIRIGDSSHSMQNGECIIKDNYFYKSNGEKQEIVSVKCCSNILENNVFYESQGTLTLRHGNNNTVKNNVFIGNNVEETGGIRVIGEGHIVEGNWMENLNSIGYKAALCIVRGQDNPSLSGYFQVKNAIIRNNTFIDCNLAMHINYGSSSMTIPVIETTIENNIAIAKDLSTYVVRYETSDPNADIYWDNNIFYGKFKNNFFNLTSLKNKPDIPKCNINIEDIKNNSGIIF